MIVQHDSIDFTVGIPVFHGTAKRNLSSIREASTNSATGITLFFTTDLSRAKGYSEDGVVIKAYLSETFKSKTDAMNLIKRWKRSRDFVDVQKTTWWEFMEVIEFKKTSSPARKTWHSARMFTFDPSVGLDGEIIDVRKYKHN